MSSARSNAGARNRRAGGPETVSTPQNMNGQRPGQQQQQPGQPPQQQMNPRLSISDAIALITLRLGRVENIIQNMPLDSQTTPEEHDENTKMVDGAVFENIVSRLTALDKVQKTVIDRQQQQDTSFRNVSAQITTIQNTVPTIPDIPVITTFTPIVDTKSTEKIGIISESVDVLKAEIVQVKDLLLKLQSFTMETNQKLSDIVFSDQIMNETGILNEACYDIISATIQHTSLLDEEGGKEEEKEGKEKEEEKELLSGDDLKKMIESAILENVPITTKKKGEGIDISRT